MFSDLFAPLIVGILLLLLQHWLDRHD
ncbi:type I toxin-antitoxin system Fst family toxin [Lapidilactobacillus gannanensis]|uniref:Type I toxin-antitoxin system Fst family toxin n=1 Tax=Lapidilactobacillus gannanensis TaxID=2486002 RepID=A0ABW4BJQ0_9LACO|nr:type I toxin-antitoxin system Fst family toxin [Lapidilactobacillus gannanensis]